MPITLQKVGAPRLPAPQPAATVGDTPQLEIALLRRRLDGGDLQGESCSVCDRHLLIGERVYEYASGQMCCELCRPRTHTDPQTSHRVHGPAFGHSIRVIDRRAA